MELNCLICIFDAIGKKGKKIACSWRLCAKKNEIEDRKKSDILDRIFEHHSRRKKMRWKMKMKTDQPNIREKKQKRKLPKKKYKYRHFLRVKLLTIAERLDKKNTKNETHA